MSNPAVGTRTYGKRNIRERWYECAILGCQVPESQTVVPESPHPRAGLRVCRKCYDEPDWQMNYILNPPSPSGEESEP